MIAREMIALNQAKAADHAGNIDRPERAAVDVERIGIVVQRAGNRRPKAGSGRWSWLPSGLTWGCRLRRSGLRFLRECRLGHRKGGGKKKQRDHGAPFGCRFGAMPIMLPIGRGNYLHV